MKIGWITMLNTATIIRNSVVLGRAGLKIKFSFRECGFDSLLRHSVTLFFPGKSCFNFVWFWKIFTALEILFWWVFMFFRSWVPVEKFS